MESIEQKTIAYLLKRVEELEGTCKDLINENNRLFSLQLQPKKLNEVDLEKFKKDWQESTKQSNIVFPQLSEDDVKRLQKQEVTEKLKNLLEEDDLEELLNNLVYGEYKASLKPYEIIHKCFTWLKSKKGSNYWEKIYDRLKETSAQSLTIKEQINQKVTKILTPFLEQEDIEDLLNNFEYEKYQQGKDWTAYGLILYCFDWEISKKGLEYWSKILETLR